MDKLGHKFPYFEEVNLGILRRIGSGLKILDVGCGYGCLGEVIEQKNNVVFGVDISPIAIDRAKNRLYFACLADVTKPETLPTEIKEEKFDIVVLADIIEHIYAPRELLENVKTFLKDDGMLLISVPNAANWAIGNLNQCFRDFMR